MRAIVLREHGGPEVLRPDELPLPVPGRHQLLVQVHATSVNPGQTVLIHAGAGGVGHVAIQLARLHGCRVITTAGRDESIAFCRDVLAADEIIDYRSTDFVARCR